MNKAILAYVAIQPVVVLLGVLIVGMGLGVLGCITIDIRGSHKSFKDYCGNCKYHNFK